MSDQHTGKAFLASLGISMRPTSCVRCGKVELEFPGVCTPCGALDDQDAHALVMKPARESVPERFRWASATDPRWQRFVSEPGRAAFARLSSVPRSGLLFRGERGRGKTSMACAILNRMHSVAYDAPANVVETARRAFYVSAPELLKLMRERSQWDPVPPLAVRARSASVLVLDEVGSGQCKEGDEVWTIVQERHDRNRPVVVTTWMSEEQLGAVYGGGFARRVCERVIEC